MNGISFYDQFWSAQPKIDLETLNKNYVYMFLLCHPMNIIVVNHLKPHVYHMATYDRTTLKEIQVDLGMEQPKIFNISVEEVQQKTLECLSKPVESAGYVVVRSPTETDPLVRRYRFENVNYTKAREMRGESNNLSFLLLGYLLDSDSAKLQEFLQYYPVYQEETELLRKRMSALIGKFYREYGRRYKEKKYIYIHPRHHRFLAELHTKIYVELLKPQKKTVKYDDIRGYVEKLPVAKVLYLLNYIHDEDKDEVEDPFSKDNTTSTTKTGEKLVSASASASASASSEDVSSDLKVIEEVEDFPKLLKKKVILKKDIKTKQKEETSVIDDNTEKVIKKPILKKKETSLVPEKPKVNLCLLVAKIQKQMNKEGSDDKSKINVDFASLVVNPPKKIETTSNPNKIKIHIKTEKKVQPIPSPPQAPKQTEIPLDESLLNLEIDEVATFIPKKLVEVVAPKKKIKLLKKTPLT